MTEDKALDLAQEALKLSSVTVDSFGVQRKIQEAITAITAIKQARSAPVQEPVAWWNRDYGSPVFGFKRDTPGIGLGNPDATPLYTTPPAQPAPVQEDWGPGPHECHSLTAAPVQEPVAWKWHQAPVKTQWGHDMVVADLAIDKDHTVSVYCERDQTAKVEAMLTPPAAQRQWVGLTQQDIDIAFDDTQEGGGFDEFARAIEAKLKEKNT